MDPSLNSPKDDVGEDTQPVVIPQPPPQSTEKKEPTDRSHSSSEEDDTSSDGSSSTSTTSEEASESNDTTSEESDEKKPENHATPPGTYSQPATAQLQGPCNSKLFQRLMSRPRWEHLKVTEFKHAVRMFESQLQTDIETQRKGRNWKRTEMKKFQWANSGSLNEDFFVVCDATLAIYQLIPQKQRNETERETLMNLCGFLIAHSGVSTNLVTLTQYETKVKDYLAGGTRYYINSGHSNFRAPTPALRYEKLKTYMESDAQTKLKTRMSKVIAEGQVGAVKPETKKKKERTTTEKKEKKEKKSIKPPTTPAVPPAKILMKSVPVDRTRPVLPTNLPPPTKVPSPPLPLAPTELTKTLREAKELEKEHSNRLTVILGEGQTTLRLCRSSLFEPFVILARVTENRELRIRILHACKLSEHEEGVLTQLEKFDFVPVLVKWLTRAFETKELPECLLIMEVIRQFSSLSKLSLGQLQSEFWRCMTMLIPRPADHGLGFETAVRATLGHLDAIAASVMNEKKISPPPQGTNHHSEEVAATAYVPLQRTMHNGEAPMPTYVAPPSCPPTPSGTMVLKDRDPRLRNPPAPRVDPRELVKAALGGTGRNGKRGRGEVEAPTQLVSWIKRRLYGSMLFVIGIVSEPLLEAFLY